MSQTFTQNFKDKIQFHLACNNNTTFIHKVTYVIRQQINHMYKKHLYFSNVMFALNIIDRLKVLNEYHAQKFLDFLN